MFIVLVLVCVLRSAWSDIEHGESRVVKIKQGPVKGYKSSHGEFFVFHSIPYATAPTGSQKFKEPLPPPVWLNTFEAIDRKIVCPQHDYHGVVFHDKKEVKENCLIANVYVPKTEQKNLPVLVNVHGGGYAIGYGDFILPYKLAAAKKAIIVNFNYRLGAHGFLCLGTKDVPGNAGMKDQVALLRWVRDNIASFGGNPDDVIVTGCSAGSSSVDLLQLSKMANNLFNKIIPESGANTATFSIQVDPLEVAKKHAKKLNFTNVDDIYALEEFYKTASYDVLTLVNVMDEVDGAVSFSPCVERDTGVEKFLDDNPVNILKKRNFRKRPMLYGFAKMEGFIRVPKFQEWKDIMNAKFSDFLPRDLKFESEGEKENIATKVKEFYFGTEPISEDSMLSYIDFFSDIIIAYPMIRSLRLQVEAGNEQVYLYEYAYADEYSPNIPNTNIRIANHCAQTMAIHDGLNFTHIDESNISGDLQNIKQTLREIWLNFVTTGKPVPEGSSLPTWLPTNANASPYMVLDKVLELKETPLLEKRMQFWEEIYCKYYRYPVPPSAPPPKHTEL